MFEEYQRLFAKYGFTECPLSETDILYIELKYENVTMDQIYGVGCDVAAGVSLKEAIQYNIT